MAEFASRGVGAAGLTTGIIGTAFGAMNSGLLGNLFGGGNANCNPDNMPINRYEAEQQQKIAALETEVKLRDANFYTLGEMGKLRDYVDGKFAGIEQQLCTQQNFNTANTAAIACMQGQIAQLMGLTKLVVPNTSICPGWGTVTVTPATTPTTTG